MSNSVIPLIREQMKIANQTKDNITVLINCELKIAGFLFRLNEEVRDALREKLSAYNERKEKDAQHILTGEGTLGKKEAEAIVNNKAERDRELETEVTYVYIKGGVGATEEYLKALSQRIAHLRKEWEAKNKNV